METLPILQVTLRLQIFVLSWYYWEESSQSPCISQHDAAPDPVIPGTLLVRSLQEIPDLISEPLLFMYYWWSLPSSRGVNDCSTGRWNIFNDRTEIFSKWYIQSSGAPVLPLVNIWPELDGKNSILHKINHPPSLSVLPLVLLSWDCALIGWEVLELMFFVGQH